MITEITTIANRANKTTFAEDKTNTFIIETFLIIKLKLSL
jgi:hypothetical protein